MTASQERIRRTDNNDARLTGTRLPGQRERDASESGAAREALDRVLELFEQGQLSATEMRVLLRLLERRDASIPELAKELCTGPADITRAGRRLAMRGLVRWQYGRRPEQALLNLTAAGAAAIGVLLTALGRIEAAPARGSAPPASPVAH